MASAKETGASVAAVASGGGSGGLMVFLATTYLTGPLQDIAIYLSPTASILAGGAFSTAHETLKAWNADRTVSQELAKARERLSRIEKDPKSTDAHRAEARRKVEALEILAFQIHDSRIKRSVRESE